MQERRPASRRLKRQTAAAQATVSVRGRCSGPLKLSGPLDASVTWLGVGAAAHTGGLELPVGKFGPVTDPTALGLLPSVSAGAVKQLNLSALGLDTNAIGKLKPHHYPGGNAQINFYLFEGSGQAELFWGEEALHLARYPNSEDDQLLIPQNSMLIRSVQHGESGAEVNRVSDMPSEDGRGVPARGSARMSKWASELAAGRDVWAHGECEKEPQQALTPTLPLSHSHSLTLRERQRVVGRPQAGGRGRRQRADNQHGLRAAGPGEQRGAERVERVVQHLQPRLGARCAWRIRHRRVRRLAAAAGPPAHRGHRGDTGQRADAVHVRWTGASCSRHQGRDVRRDRH